MFSRFQLAYNGSTRSQSFPCLVGFYLSCKQSWWWLYCCYCSCSSTCCCCLAAHVSRCWLGKIPVCRRRSPRHYYGTTLALLRGRQQPSGGGVGPGWARADQVLVCLQTSWWPWGRIGWPGWAVWSVLWFRWILLVSLLLGRWRHPATQHCIGGYHDQS